MDALEEILKKAKVLRSDIAVLAGDLNWRLDTDHVWDGSVEHCIREGDWKLIETFDPKGLELYHLGRDLSETTNLAKKETAKLAELRKELAAWRNEVDAEMMEPNPNHAK